jgi:WD40 repeat protein
MLRETGGGWGGSALARRSLPPVRVLAPVSLLPDALSRVRVLRGHRDAVYCAIFDAGGTRLITGSDDLLVKIWSAATGMLLRTCRGHEREITYLAASADDALVASASIDHTIRTWRLADGVPVSVLLGHTQVVTELAFHPAQEHAHILLSVSMDGSARVWDALSSDSLPLVVDLADEGGAEAEAGAAVTAASHICCAFSPDGSLFAVGTHDFSAAIWRLDITAEGGAAGTVAAQLLTRLRGHRNEISFVQFVAAGDALLSGGKDGTVRVWRAPPGRTDRRRASRGGRAAGAAAGPPALEPWTQAHVLSPPAPPPAPHVRRQRAPPAVNMVRWSVDGRTIIAAMEDASVCLWDPATGALRARLLRHGKEAFVVEPHPFDSRLALSAGYDGRVVLWDVVAASVAAEWDLRGALPEDGMRLLDARWSPDGTGFAVSDEGGGVHLFCACDAAATRHAQLDQFFASDYAPLMRDARGFVADAATGRPPHLAPPEPLCHYDAALARLLPYPEPYQSAFQQHAVRILGVPAEEADEAFTRDPRVVPQPPRPPASTPAADAGPARRQRLFRVGGAAAATAADADAIAIALLSSSSSSSEDDDDDEDASGASEDDSDALRPTRRGGARRMDRSYEGESGEEDDEGATGEDATADDDDDDEFGGAGGDSDDDGGRRRISRRVRAREHADRERRAGLRTRRREAAASDALAAAAPVYATRNAGARRGRSMRDSSGGEEEDEEEDARGRRSKRLRRGAAAERLYTFSSEDDDDDDSPRRAQRKLRDRQRRDRDRALKQARREEREAQRVQRREARAAARAEGGDDGAGTSRPAPMSRRAATAAGFRPCECWSWLQHTSWRLGEYIPQLGDAVVYIAEGHSEYLAGCGDARALRPWLSIPMFRAAEPCIVTDLHYAIVRDKANATVARLTLTLTDVFGALRGERFELELPDMTREGGSPDFLVPLSRFRASAARAWGVSDRCVAWWPDAGDAEGGRFWAGTVWAASDDETAWRGSPWNRLSVDYDTNDKDDEPYKQSPWELFEPAPNTGGGSSKWVPRDEARPGLEPDLAAALTRALAALAAAPANAALCQPPGEEALAGPEGAEFYAGTIALPLGLDTLRLRVASGYYRQPEAVRHDVLTLRGNAFRAHGEGAPEAAAAADAADALLALLPPPSSLPTLKLDGTWPVLLTGPRAPVTRSRRTAPSAAELAAAAAAEHGTRSAVAAAMASQEAATAANENARFSVRLRVRP